MAGPSQPYSTQTVSRHFLHANKGHVGIAHLFQLVRQTLKDEHLDSNDGFAGEVAAHRAEVLCLATFIWSFHIHLCGKAANH